MITPLLNDTINALKNDEIICRSTLINFGKCKIKSPYICKIQLHESESTSGV